MKGGIEDDVGLKDNFLGLGLGYWLSAFLGR